MSETGESGHPEIKTAKKHKPSRFFKAEFLE